MTSFNLTQAVQINNFIKTVVFVEDTMAGTP